MLVVVRGFVDKTLACEGDEHAESAVLTFSFSFLAGFGDRGRSSQDPA